MKIELDYQLGPFQKLCLLFFYFSIEHNWEKRSCKRKNIKKKYAIDFVSKLSYDTYIDADQNVNYLFTGSSSIK